MEQIGFNKLKKHVLYLCGCIWITSFLDSSPPPPSDLIIFSATAKEINPTAWYFHNHVSLWERCIRGAKKFNLVHFFHIAFSWKQENNQWIKSEKGYSCFCTAPYQTKAATVAAIFWRWNTHRDDGLGGILTKRRAVLGFSIPPHSSVLWVDICLINTSCVLISEERTEKLGAGWDQRTQGSTNNRPLRHHSTIFQAAHK